MSELKYPFKFKDVDDLTIYTVSLREDDKVTLSWVKDNEQHSTVYCKSTVEMYITSGHWEVVNEHNKEQDPKVAIRQSEVDAYIDEINMLRELVAEITLQSDFNSLEQQAEAFRVLNDKMLSHQSYKQGDGGSTRIGELSKQLDVLFAAYDSLAGKQKEQTFKPISEMILEDWQQAMEEGWEFLDNYGDVNNVTEVTYEVFFSGYCCGFSVDGKHNVDPTSYFIKARIK